MDYYRPSISHQVTRARGTSDRQEAFSGEPCLLFGLPHFTILQRVGQSVRKNMKKKLSKEARSEPSSKKPIVLTWRATVAPSKQTKARRLVSDRSHKTPHAEGLQTSFQSSSSGFIEESAFQLPVVELARPAINEISATLDPFCQLPHDLSLEDRHLFHSYLLTVPNNVYGTRTDTIFSSVRDVSFPISLSSPLTLQWMLIAAHGKFSRNGISDVQAQTQLALLRRKGRAYQSLNDALKRSPQVVSDEILGGIIMAIITESRLSDPEASNSHLLGYEVAVHLRGGLRNIILTSSAKTTTHMSHIMPYLVCPPVASQSNRGAAQELASFLKFFASEVGRLDNIRSETWKTDLIGDFDLPSLTPPKSRPLITGFLLKGELAGYVQPRLVESWPYMDQSSHFLSSYLIAITLLRLDNFQETYTEQFLLHLCTVLKQSSTFDGNGKPLLTTQGFTWVVLKSVMDLGDMFYLRDASSQHKAQTIVDAVNALKVFRSMQSYLARNDVIFFLGRLFGYAK